MTPNNVIDVFETSYGETYGYCPHCEITKGKHHSMVFPIWSFCPYCGNEITFDAKITNDYKVIKCDWCNEEMLTKDSYVVEDNGEKTTLCGDCIGHIAHCERCEKVCHEDEIADDLCECCHDDMYG